MQRVIINNFWFKRFIISIKIARRKGGLKMKLISFVTLAILLTIGIQSLFSIYLMGAAIEKKAFEVSTTSIERIADLSLQSLLERTYENRLNLNEVIQKIQHSNIDGLLGVSIFERQKENNTTTFHFLAGFGNDTNDTHLDKKLFKMLNNSLNDSVTYESYKLRKNNLTLDTYRFVKPIIYTIKDKKVLLGVAILYYDKEAITGVIRDIINLVLLLSVIIILIAIVIVYFIGVQFTKPILSITKAATDVSKGNLDINLKVDTNDEIQDLAERFNKMVNGLRERKKMKKFISNSTMDMIQKNSMYPTVLGGEYATLTFLFSDIRNFISMSENKKPNEVVKIVNFYLNLQATIIKAHNGDIDKFVGDEIMASFSGEDATNRAIQCALNIQNVMEEENEKRKLEDKTICEVGIGINRGEVVVGNIGSNERMDFTSIGSVVNIASRLCSNAKAGQILIEQNTYNLSNTNYEASLQKQIFVKGISQAVNIYSIILKSKENE